MPKAYPPTQPLTVDEQSRFEAAMPLLGRVAGAIRRTLPRTVELDDLIQWGSFGLADAVRKFDPDRNVHFETYASRRIRGAILDGIRSMDWVPRLARSRKEAVPRIDSSDSLSCGKDSRAFAFMGDGDTGLPASDVQDYFDDLCWPLNHRQRLAIKLMYVDGLNQAEATQAIGISQCRISQLHGRALDLLRKRLSSFGRDASPSGVPAF